MNPLIYCLLLNFESRLNFLSTLIALVARPASLLHALQLQECEYNVKLPGLINFSALYAVILSFMQTDPEGS